VDPEREVRADPERWQGDPPEGDTTSGLALASLICGVLGLTPLLPVVGAVAALVLGKVAKNRIERSEGRLGGLQLARAGMMLGFGGLVLAFIALLFWFGN
jgi:hypothetical protein